MKNPEELQKSAHKHSRQHMKGLVNAKLEVLPGSSQCEWDPVLRRQIQRSLFHVWRDIDTIQASLAPNGSILELTIPSRFISKDNLTDAPPLKDEEILDVIATTGLTGDTTNILNTHVDSQHMTRVDIIQAEDGLPSAITFTINPASRQVAAFSVTKPSP